MTATHAYCNNCEEVRSVFFEKLRPVVASGMAGDWLGGDVVCRECAWVVATLFTEAE